MRILGRLSLGIVVLFVGMGVFCFVGCKSDPSEGTSQGVVEPLDTVPAQEILPPVEETPAVEPEPLEEPAPAKEPAVVKAPQKREAKPKEVVKPKEVEKPVEKAPDPIPEPVEEKPAPATEPVPVPEPVKEPEPVKAPEPVKKPEPKKVEVVADNNEIVASAEEMPKFRGGGLKKFQDYINENTNYPQVAAEMGVQGRVKVSFVVEKNGSVSNVKVVKSIDPLLDREAIRVVKSSPRWTPGKNGGRPIRVSQTASVLFVLR